MWNLRTWLLVGCVVVASLAISGCSDDPTASEDYQALAQELDRAQAALASITAERDQLLSERDALAADDARTEARYEAAKANQATLVGIIEDPAAFGDENEVLDLLDSLATPDIVSGDLAFGGTGTGYWRTGWRNTLYGNGDATLRTWRTWLSEDGSVGGSLWSWFGTAANGEPFSLEGLELSRFSDDGLYSEVVMLYPYEDEEVHRRIREGNQPSSIEP